MPEASVEREIELRGRVLRRLGENAKLRGALRTPTGRTSGALQGVRGKIWNRFDGQLDNFTDTLWVTKDNLEAALDAINERPLYESATQRLARALRERSNDDLAALIVDLHHDDRLCVPPAPQGTQAEPNIVCSMGLRADASPAG